MSLTAEIIIRRGFQVEVIRTGRRKTATVKIVDGKVSVVVPHRTSKAKVEELVTKKTRWITEKLLLLRKHQPGKPKEYVNGECFTYLGKNYRLKVVSGPVKSVKLIKGRLVVQVPPSVQNQYQYAHAALEEWYRIHALMKLREKVDCYSKIIGVTPSSIVIKTFKSRWGSCHTNGKVDFNWKIIITLNRIVVYVVVHELCHLQHHNHSPEFWRCVERVFPDYRECKEWLKVNGGNLRI